ncbi:periplasmic heavy metal sensor [Hymenobacter oligotrophus]|uniref:Periplasmic heavy metal sensor n=1 Tax=Hymenobacter oligotrophus TaxID=2319843 RepID=A0A3B7RPG6_9BACT|nr:periplasmic heavy metal sensor [Hymenobacter oligotrophus]AYA36107.1 periplasmic heavy metal sensor [Hymenobacter oligotrophus]
MKLFRLLYPLLVLLALGAGAPAMAQRPGGPGNGPRMERLESARVAYITEKLALTPEQSQRFWPLFNEYTEKRRALRRQAGEARRGTDYSAMSDKDIRAALNQQFAMRQNELNLDKEYVARFEKVITLRQVAQLQQAEREFTRALIKRLDNRPAQAATNDD